MRNFPNFIDSYLTFTENQESSVRIHRWVAISIIAAALERKVWLNQGHWLLFPNLYVFIIGPSGIVRKSTSTGIGVDLIRSLPGFKLMSERVTAASLIAQLERSGRKFALKDGTEMRQSAVFSYASELSIFLGEVFGSISELLTTFYDCAPNDWRKPWIYENKGEGEIRIHGPCLNILGASTSAWLIRCIPPSEMEGGFSSRVIFVVEKDPPQKLVAWPEIDHASEGVRKKLIEDLTRINELVGSMAVTPDAKDWYTKYYNEQRTALMKATDLRFSGYYGRKTSTILKVAMCLSVADSDSLVIEEKHMREAQRLLDDLEVNMFDAFGASGDNASSPILRKIWTTIKRENEISHAELLRIHWRDVDHRDLIGLMETLNNMGAIRVFKQGSKVIYTPSDKEVRL